MGIDFRVPVSVVIPVYNRAETVLRALNSALSQTLPPEEVIIIDDCSTDGTAEILDHLRHPIVKIIHLERNQGAQYARIRGIVEAKGDYIAFLDSDDEWLPDSLETRITSFWAAGFKEGLIYGDARFNGREGELFAYERLNGLQFEHLLKELSLCPFSVMMISRSCFKIAGLPSTDFPSWQDDDTVLTVGRMFPVHHCGAVVAIMYRSQNCISVNKDSVYKGCRKIVAKYANDIIHCHGHFRYYLWKLRVVNSLIISKLSTRAIKTDEFSAFDTLMRYWLIIVQVLLRRFLKIFFVRVNS